MKTPKLTGKAMFETKLQTVRVCEEPAPLANCPQQLHDIWKQHVTQTSWFEPTREQLVLFTLDVRYQCTGYFLISVGSLNESIAHPREIMRPVIMAGAYAFALAHNHPSGCTDPSEADRRITRQIQTAADLMCVRFLDHIIIGDDNVPAYSFREFGLL